MLSFTLGADTQRDSPPFTLTLTSSAHQTSSGISATRDFRNVGFAGQQPPGPPPPSYSHLQGGQEVHHPLLPGPSLPPEAWRPQPCPTLLSPPAPGRCFALLIWPDSPLYRQLPTHLLLNSFLGLPRSAQDVILVLASEGSGGQKVGGLLMRVPRGPMLHLRNALR